jgi:hypothetical protein
VDAAERSAILAEWERQVKEGVPPNVGPVGCAVAILAGAVLIVLPRVLGTHLPFWLKIPLVVVVIAGFVFHQFGGSGGRNLMRGRVERALTVLGGAADPDQRRVAAVALLHNAHDTRGPAMSSVYDREEVRIRLGGALAEVIVVERVLREERNIYPVFTLPTDSAT